MRVTADDFRSATRLEAQTSNQYGMAVSEAAVAPPIRHLVLRTAEGTIIQPLSVVHDDAPSDWSPHLTDDVALAQMPSGPFEVVLVTTNGETVIAVGAETRKRIR